MTRVLAVLAGDRAGLSLELGDDVSVDRVSRLSMATRVDEVDVVIFDAAAGDGWPFDNALAAAAICSGRCGLLVLCTSAADVTTLEQQLDGSLVLPVVLDSSAETELDRLVQGLAAKWRVAGKRQG